MRGNALRRTLQTDGVRYEETGISHCVGLSLGSVSAFAYDYRYDNRTAYVSRDEAGWIGASIASIGCSRTSAGS